MLGKELQLPIEETSVKNDEGRTHVGSLEVSLKIKTKNYNNSRVFEKKSCYGYLKHKRSKQ